ncbi:retrovirus-related pol polyprotein from transposon TNT 1-94 [Tanacetum coccineum]
MATTDKESSAAGTDNRPPMLGESNFESWKIRIERYIRGKPLGKLIWKSIKNGPTPHPTITVTTGEGEQQTQVTREKTDEEFTEAENNKERADIQATNILSQGLPRHIFNTLNQTETAKEIWENVELLMQGSGLTEQQKKETLFDQYERFRANGNESIHDYFVRFHKLINDMKITKMEIPVHQRNTKFVNNLPSYWGKYVTIVKNSKDISTVSYVDLYTHLKSYEQHAMKTLSKMNQTSGNADPLAYMAQATQSTSSPSQYVPPPPQYAPAPQQAPQSTNDAMLATMNQIVNLLSGFQKQFPPTNNQLRTSTNPMTQATIQAGQITTESVQRRAPGNKGKHAATGSQGKVVTCYNCRGQGHVARECKEKKRAKDSQWFKDKALLMEAKEKGAILDAEAEAFLADVECTTPYAEPLAITTTTAFEVSHEDAYDSNVDEAPHAAVAFMANLMQTGPSTGQGTSNDTDFHSEVHTYDNHFFDNMNLQVSQEIHGGEQLDSDVDSVIDDHDNTIPYHQYQLNNEVESVPTDVSSVVPGGISVITILDDLRSQLAGHIKTNEEQSFANDALKAELERYKTQVQNLEQSKVKKDLEQLVFERNKRNADLEEQLVSLKQQLLQHVESNKSLKTESEKLKADNNALEESYLEELVWLRNTNKDLHKYALGHHNLLYLKSAQLCRPTLYLGDVIVEPVHTPLRVYDSEKTLIQAECLLAESVSKDICSIVLTSDIVVPISVEPRSNCVEEHSRNMELEAEILKVCNNSSSPELNVQGKDELLRKLKGQIGNMKEVSADSNLSTLEFQALETKNTQLKEELAASEAESNSNVSIRAAVPEKPKVLAPGLYAMKPKYIPPQKRNNREANTPLPRKETVSLVKKTNVCVNLSTAIKFIIEASKSKSKYETKTHRNLPSRSENVKRVDNPLRSLNKRNRVDSSLSVKRTGFISKFVSVCKTCIECLVFGNHNKCGVKKLNSVNAKIFASVGSKWRPTGRKFTLGDTCPLTRITKPEVVPLEKSRSVSTSEPANNVIVTPRFSKKPLTSYKRKDSKLKDTSTGSPPNAETKAVNDPVVQIILWYLDSGCSRHMTGDRSKLINYVEKFIGTVRFGNDQFAAIVGYGDYKFGDTIITRVYYVEGLSHNLFSVGQFCDAGLEVAFRKYTCYIRNKDKVDLLKGSRTTNLYSISLKDMMEASPVCLLSKASSTKSWLWHRRLNHLNFRTLNELARKDLVRGLPKLKYEKEHLCPSCQLGKSKKSSHPLKTVNTNTEVLNTLHMDLCGPMRVESINGKKYILVIVDDYTRFGWVRFLRTKDETPEVIKKFIILTQRALNATVRYLRTDNGTEFVNKTLTEFCESVGITHNTSVPQTPQQNDILWTLRVIHLIDLSFIHYMGRPTMKCLRVKAKADIGPEINNLQSGRIGSRLVTTPTTPSVPPIEKQLSEQFQPLFNEDEEFPPDVHPHLVNVAPPRAPEIAPDLPSSTTVTEDAPATTTITSPSQTSPLDTGVNGPEHTFTASGSESFENSVTNEFDSEASSSGTVNVNPT